MWKKAWKKAQIRNKTWPGLLALFLLATAAWGFTDHNLATGPLSIAQNDGDGTITGTYTDGGTAITVEDGYSGKISFDNVNITTANIPLDVGKGADVELVLVNNNILTGSVTMANPALNIQSGSIVTISGTGRLTAAGNPRGSPRHAINAPQGSIFIGGGYVSAKGGSGTGGNGINAFEFTISGGTVTAIGGDGGSIITGGSVKADNVDPRPKNAPGGDELTRSDVTGKAGQTISLTVTGTGAQYPYTYTAPFHANHANIAYVWLPTTSSFSATLPTVTASATNDGNGSSITLKETASQAAAGQYQWQKQDTNGGFQDINGATDATYTDAGLTSGGTYAYRVTVSFDADASIPYDYSVTSETVSATVTGGGGGGGDETSSTIADLLKALNEKLAPGASVAAPPLSDAAKAALAGAGYINPTTATRAPSGTAPFALKGAPAASIPDGYGSALRPSFTTDLGLSGADGNLLALSLSLNIAGLSGYANWSSLSDADRAKLLDDAGLLLAYEYADGTWAQLIPGVMESWVKALEAGVVKFTATGVTFNYAILDGAGDPFVAGDLLAIPDGKSDGRLVDPVWLLAPRRVPTGIALTPDALSLKVGESGTATVTLTPADATERELVWTVANTNVASVTKTANADVFTVKGLAEGITTLTVEVSADRNVKTTLGVTVFPDSDLFESVAVSPSPPYHPGEEVEIVAKLTRAPTRVTASVERPDGKTDTPTVEIDGTDAWATYTLEELGTYTVTLTATDATGSYAKTAKLTVTQGGAEYDSSSGGCSSVGWIAAILALLLLPPLAWRRAGR